MYNKKISISLVASFLLATNSFSNELYISSATKSEQSIKDVTSNIEVITKEDIEERNFTTVVEALNSLPGISFTRNGGIGSSTSIFLRGNDTQKTLVLIDGIRYNDVTSPSGADFTNLPIDNIEQIEVIKGAQSGIWGADATAGVINIITKKPVSGFSANSNIEYGSFNTKKLVLGINYADEDLYTRANLSKLNTDGYSTQVIKGQNIDDFEDDSYENINGSLTFGYKIDESNSVELSHSIIKAKSEYDGCENYLWNASFGGYYSCSDTDENKANSESYITKSFNTFSSIKYSHKSDVIDTKFFTNISRYNKEYSNIANYTGGAKDSTSEKILYEYDGSLKEYGAEFSVPYLNKKSFLSSGINVKEFEHKNSINDSYLNKAIYITNSNSFNDSNTVITQSIRYDRFDKFDNKTTGKIGLKQNILKNLEFSTNYGTAYNVPTIFHLSHPIYGVPSLNPEKTKAYDISLKYKNLKLTYFNTKIKDLIEYDRDVSSYNNIEGTSTIKGYEVSFKENIFANTFINLNYTHLSAKDSDDEDLARRPKNQIDYGIDYYGLKKLHINLNGSYIGKSYDKPNKTGDKTGNYTVWNSVVNYDINKNLKTYLKVDNLFNKYYQTVDGYATSPRAFYAGLKATF